MPTPINRTTTVVHVTGRDLLEAQRRHDETAARLRSEHEQAKAAQLAHLSTTAAWLHQRVVAIIALAVYGAALLVAMVISGSGSAFGSILALLVLALTLGPAVVDWWNFRTMHGRINWPLMKLDHPVGYVWAIVGAVLVFPVWGAAYFIDCIRTVPAVAQGRRAHMQQEITRLEQELRPELPEEQKQPVH